jgi:hypothetical protein
MIMPTQKTNIYNPSGYGLDYTQSSQTWTIANDVFVGSKSAYGAFSNYNGSKLINKGHIYAADNYGVVFVGNNSAIVNQASGDVFGNYGVYMQGLHAALTNHGSIAGYEVFGVWAYNTSHFVLHNDGDIYGQAAGVNVQSTGPGYADSMIDNSGLIQSNGYAVEINTAAGERTTIVNDHGAKIKGNSFAILAFSGSFSLENHGELKGQIASSAIDAGDKVYNYGAIKSSVFLGPGDDLFKNKGGSAGKVSGGPGNDKLVAGPHTDKFVFDATLNPTTNVDTVKHFDPGKDEFFLYKAVFTALTAPGTLEGSQFHIGKHAHDNDDHIIYNQNTGALLYDSNGNANGGEVQFAKLDKGLNLHHSDFIVFA